MSVLRTSVPDKYTIRMIFISFLMLFLITVLVSLNTKRYPEGIEFPELVAIPNGSFYYLPAGSFRQGTRVVDAPMEVRKISGLIELMKYPVSVREYDSCVKAGFCNEVAPSAGQNLAQTGVSYLDAIAYSQWFTKITGDTWRLPKDEEWVRAASERFVAQKLSINSADPSKRWLAEYTKQHTERAGASSELRSIGGYGENSLGVVDLSGSVWEWTQSCMLRGVVSVDGSTLTTKSEYCGIRIAEGRHRAFIIDFIRDPKVGGCAVGLPPNYLGFRLVREKRND